MVRPGFVAAVSNWVDTSCDRDAIAEFVSSTDMVVTAVVGPSPPIHLRDEFFGVNDHIRLKLERVAAYMDKAQHQSLMMLWDESCQWVQASCEASVSALGRLSNGICSTAHDLVAGDLIRDVVKGG